MILIIDNYDSFTYNLYQYVGEINNNVLVKRNDEITIEEIEGLNPTHLIISPGPGFPKDAGISSDLIKHFSGKIPILGVCLGHQTICEVFGGKIIHAPCLFHGKASDIKLYESELFLGIDKNIRAARYHSLIAEKASFPNELKIIGETDDGIIMAVEHKEYKVFGVQFHPESIITNEGKKIINNFINI